MFRADDGRAMEPWQLSVSQSVEAMADGSLDCVDVIESVLLRIGDLNPTINALVSVASCHRPSLARECLRPESMMFGRAADHLAGAGYCVVDATPPPIEDAFRAWLRVATTELVVGLGPIVELFGSEDTRQLLQWTIDSREVLGRDDYMESLGDPTRMARAWALFMVEYPLVLTPFMTQPMYDWDFDTRSHAEVDEVLERSMHAFGINHLGLPAGVIGMDLVEERPAGVQIGGNRSGKISCAMRSKQSSSVPEC